MNKPQIIGFTLSLYELARQSCNDPQARADLINGLNDGKKGDVPSTGQLGAAHINGKFYTVFTATDRDKQPMVPGFIQRNDFENAEGIKGRGDRIRLRLKEQLPKPAQVATTPTAGQKLQSQLDREALQHLADKAGITVERLLANVYAGRKNAPVEVEAAPELEIPVQ